MDTPNINLQKLHSIFDSITDLKLKKDLYLATGNFKKASELEQELFFDEFKKKKITCLEDYISILNESSLKGISSNDLLKKFFEFKEKEIKNHQGEWQHVDDSWVVACNYYDLALFHEARFGVHYDESDLKKSFEFRQKVLELDEDLILVNEFSPAKSTRGVRINSAECIESILNYASAFSNLLLHQEKDEQLVAQNVEIFSYLANQNFTDTQIKEAIMSKRIEFLEVLTESALARVNDIYSKKEKEDKNKYLSWCFKCACAYIYRATNFAQRLSESRNDKVEAIKLRLNEGLNKLNTTYDNRKYSEENFSVWVQKLVDTENPVPDHKTTGPGWYIKEDDLMWPKKITLASKF